MSGLRGMKRSWSGNQSDLEGLEAIPLPEGAYIDRKGSSALMHDIKNVANSLGSMQEPISLATPSPDKKSKSESSIEIITLGSSTESESIRKRKLPGIFGNGSKSADEVPNSRYGFKTVTQLKNEGAKTAFHKNGGGSTASSSINTFGASKVSVGKVFLSKEQRVVNERAVNLGRNVFFTGSAGTGKSVVLREIIKGLRAKHAPKADAVAVTASTGIAACNIGGVTLHSFAGCGLGLEPVPQLVSKVKKNRKSASRWMRTNVLIIDEISMVDPDFLDKLNELGQLVRKSSKPFGGIQIIMTGDFFQLPPVNKTSSATRYAFDAKCWGDLVQESICLTQVFRQKDADFVNMLNEMRFGTLSPNSIKVFQSLQEQSELEKKSKMPATALYPLRAEVERANADQLRKLTRQKSHVFNSIDGGTMTGEARTRQLENFMCPAKLWLKAGCQVMLIKNKDETLVNGSIGTVLTFLARKDFSKAQYCGLNWEDVDPEKMAEEEILTHLNDNYWEAVNGSSGAKRDGKGAIDETRAAQMEEWEAQIRKEEKKEKLARSRSSSPDKQSEDGNGGIEPQKFPIVRFFIGKGRYRTELMEPEIWKNEQPNGEVVLSRTQVPLILAWAMSIHKSQGQTIPIVKIDLGKVFEKGQAYVALSRAVSKEGLQVLNFNPHKVMADKRVIKWYETLSTID